MTQKLLKISAGLLIIFAVVLGLISINHPIIPKWLVGSARIIGRPIKAAVYTDGQLNKNICVFQVDKYWDNEKANYYLIYFPIAETRNSIREVISLNLKDNYVGKPSGTCKKDYDIIFGLLFQSEFGAHFSKFEDDMKGYGFDPKLKFSDRHIELNIPPSAKQLK